MKKLLLLLAVCSLVVACGGEKKKDEKGGEKNTEQTVPTKEGKVAQAKEEKAAPAEEKLTVAQLFDAMYDALQNNDMERFFELAVTTDAWGDELTPAQEKELEAYFEKSPEKMMAVITAIEEIDFEEMVAKYEEDYTDVWSDDDDDDVWSDDDDDDVWSDDDDDDVWSDDDDDDVWSDDDDDDVWSDDDEW